MVDNILTFMGFNMPMDGYGYATLKIAEALRASYRDTVHIVDMRNERGEFGSGDGRRWEVAGLALAMCVPEWLSHITAPEGVALYTMFESSRLPRGWPALLNRYAGGVIVPCEWCATTFRENNVATPLYVAPLGVDTDDFPYMARERRNGAPFTFLWSGTPDHRKGWDLAYQCFRKAFGDREDVQLRLHFRKAPTGLTGIGDSNVEMSSGMLPHAEMLDLLRAVDCYVYPSRGEGWGSPPREAAATGLPVIATDWSGLSHEIAEWAYPLRVARMGRATGRYGLAQWGDIGEWAEPDPEHLIELYRWTESHRDEAEAFGARAAGWLAIAAQWTRTAAALGAAVEEVRMVGRSTKTGNTMRIRWVGPQVVRRVVGGYEWSKEAGWEHDVPEGLALELLTAPNDHFELVEGAPTKARRIKTG